MRNIKIERPNFPKEIEKQYITDETQKNSISPVSGKKDKTVKIVNASTRYK
jgi:hypothetical protein